MVKTATIGNMERIVGTILPPSDYVHLPDVGCAAALKLYGYSGKCLDCTLPACLEDKRPREKRALRDYKISSLYEAGFKGREIADRLGICLRTVWRILAESANGNSIKEAHCGRPPLIKEDNTRSKA